MTVGNSNETAPLFGSEAVAKHPLFHEMNLFLWTIQVLYYRLHNP